MQNNCTIKTTMRILIIIAFSLFAVTCKSQITIVTPQEKEKTIEVQEYDSLESLNYENAPLHLGQTLFIKGNKETKKNSGFYDCFYTKILSSNEFYSPQGETFVYKPIIINKLLGGELTTMVLNRYSEFIGKYYQILAIETDSSIGKPDYWFKLLGDDNIPFYFKVSISSNCNKFLTVGHYEKMKQLLVNKEFYTQGAHVFEKIDIKEKVSVPSKTKFKCIDIGVNMGEDGPIFAILENENYGKIKGVIIKGQELDNFVSATKFDEYVKKYGPKYGASVAVGAVVIGMRSIMVLDAVGHPKHINTTRTNNKVQEQWVFPGGIYLYFENDILKSIQD